jgi:hypothetical protein
MQMELRPHVDALELAVPTSLAIGTSVAAGASVIQENRRVPVAFPVSADWWGSAQLYVGPARQAPPWTVAAYDPATGQLTGLRPGTAELGVTVNGVTKSTSVQVSG